MNPRDIRYAKDPDLPASLQAIRRAADAARNLGIQTNTGIVVVEDGTLIHVTADELRRDMAGRQSG